MNRRNSITIHHSEIDWHESDMVPALCVALTIVMGLLWWLT